MNLKTSLLSRSILGKAVLGKAVGAAAVGSLLVVATGCESNSFIDPSELPTGVDAAPRVVPILDNVTLGLEEDGGIYAGARDVRAEDVVASATDYKIGPNDLLQINVPDLLGPGLLSTDQKRVSETGWVSLQYVGKVDVTGLTEPEAQDKIAEAYKLAGLLQDPQVSVTVLQAQNQIYTIQGAVQRAGPYTLRKGDYRLLDALGDTGGVTSEEGIDYVYVIRDKAKKGATTEPAGMTPATPVKPAAPGSDPLMPRSAAPAPRVTYALVQDAAPATAPAGDATGRVLQPEGAAPTPAVADPLTPAPVAPVAPVSPDAPAQPVVVAPVPEVTAPNTASSFEFAAPAEPSDKEVIKVPLAELRQKGALKYNIVIRPNDMIMVPFPIQGEYYMGGHIARTGVYSLTARRITISQAIIGAGMMDQVAIPARSVLKRRVGKDAYVMVRIDIERIYAGLEPDIVLKPYDQIHVGTNFGAPFLAAIRNGFRVTYGFGFLYDKNYADPNNNN
jgi:protein involved in polysaccharide export with SLBB domain